MGLIEEREVQARIDQLQANIIARNDVDADRMVKRLYAIATADARDLVQIGEPGKDGLPTVTFTPTAEMSRGAAALFKGVKINRKHDHLPDVPPRPVPHPRDRR